jgi:putative hydrolase of the HAD superfamily
VLRGELTFAQALTQIGTSLSAAIPPARIQHACDERIRANTDVFQKIDLDLLAMTRDLHSRGVRLATISNCMAEDVVAWPTSAFAPHFACAVFSFAVGVAKPDPGIYLHAIEHLGVKPEHTLYIGDGGDDELAGAERAGLHAAKASWFVSRTEPTAVPVLSGARDVLRFVSAAGSLR